MGHCLLGCFAAALLGVACGGASAPALSPADRAAIGEGAVCQALDSVSDLQYAVSRDADFAAGAPLAELTVVHERLAETKIAAARIEKVAPGTKIAQDAKAYQEELAKYTEQLDAAAAPLRGTYEAAFEALDTAFVCQGTHVLALRKVTKEKPAYLLERLGPATPEEKKEALTLAKSKACAANARMGVLFGDMSLASPVTIRRLTAQAKELTLDPPAAALRDRMVPALLAHAKALETYTAFFADKGPQAADGARPFAKIGPELSTDLKETRRACLHREQASKQEGATTEDARSVVVTVRPKWTGKLKELSEGSGGFGSGFLVRAKDAQGKVQTLVVTNRHVMEGALEADIVPADADDGSADSLKKMSVGVTLVMLDPTDDVAILKFNDEPQGRYANVSVRFRATPVAEQEGVVAAGFPAVGNRPSFQVTKGIVSNAHFGGTDEDVGISYVQHTAPIDPGNSGGPLLDDRGRVIGINTAKLRGRENTNLAIPTVRILASLARLSRTRTYNADHAQASCDAALAALAAPAPHVAWTSRFARSLYESPGADTAPSADQAAFARVNYRNSVQGAPENPLADARVRAYEGIRRRMDAEGGISAFSRCEPRSEAGGTFTMNFRTRLGATHTVQLADEAGELRVLSVK